METSLGSKPYKFVPLIGRVDIQTSINQDGSKLDKLYSGRLKIDIKVLTPVHIGQGNCRVENNKLVMNFMRRNERIVIPGSSIKGLIRSIYESISESCSPMLPNHYMPLAVALPNKRQNTCKEIKRLCPTCSVFGMISSQGGYKSKLRFSEFKLTSEEKKSLMLENLPKLETPFKSYPEPTTIKCFNTGQEKRKGKAIYGNERLYYADLGLEEEEYNQLTKMDYYKLINEYGENRNIKFRGRKFYLHNLRETSLEKEDSKNDIQYEMVKVGSSFSGDINFELLTEKELAILSLALGVGQAYKYKIGYAKPAYYGSIELEVKEVKDSVTRYGMSSNLSLDVLKGMANKYKEQANSEVKIAINKLEEILTARVVGPAWEKSQMGNKTY